MNTETNNTAIAGNEKDLKTYLTREEIQQFTKKDDAKAFQILALNWLAIFAILGVVYVWPNPLTIIFAMLFLPGRQLGLSVLMHDCGHKIFFESRERNDFYGQWFCANPMLQDIHSYARGHLKHHQHAGTEQDPDLSNYRNYPVSKESFQRKIQRDITGKTGIKLLKLILQVSLWSFSDDKEKRKFARPFIQELFVQVIFITVLTIFMSPWLYVLWMASWLTTYMLVVRLRQVAEHGAVPNLFELDPRKNTRTTIPNWLERALIAPNYVNYHLEHHFLASVPCYNLPKLHKLLKERGAYEHTPIVYGYMRVLRDAVA